MQANKTTKPSNKKVSSEKKKQQIHYMHNHILVIHKYLFFS